MEPSQQPNFYAILPATVRYDADLSASQKIFYAEVTAMSQKEGCCWASNSYFADLYGVAHSTISSWVKALKEKGHFIVTYDKEGDQIIRRNIYPVQKPGKGSSENRGGYSETRKEVVRKSEGGSQKIGRGWSENQKGINTSINNTSINITRQEARARTREEIPSPDTLKAFEDPLVEQAFQKYLLYLRKERHHIVGPYEEEEKRFQLKKMQNPIMAINHTIANGWQKLVDPLTDGFQKKEAWSNGRVQKSRYDQWAETERGIDELLAGIR